MYRRLCGTGVAVRLTWLAPVGQIVVVGPPQAPDQHYVLRASGAPVVADPTPIISARSNLESPG
jgi:hypothetical protein